MLEARVIAWQLPQVNRRYSSACGMWVGPGDKVLANAIRLPVPGAIHAVRAEPVLVEIDADYHIDLSHLEEMAQRSGAKTLLLSHMRGHVADMEALMAIARAHHIKVVEDCAHTMGAKWQNKRSGNFGDVAAFSTQTYKHEFRRGRVSYHR